MNLPILKIAQTTLITHIHMCYTFYYLLLLRNGSLALSYPQIGLLRLLERENGAILNEALRPLARETIKGFSSALDALGLKCPLYLTKNDCTLLR